MMRGVSSATARRTACAMSMKRPAMLASTPAALVAGCAAGPSLMASAGMHGQVRHSTKWMGNLLSTVGLGPSRQTKKPEELREELPEVFERPVEVEDYIRPEKTYFEHLEDVWDWVISFASPVEKQMDWMRGLHESLDISYGFVFLLWGVTMRLISLGPMLYAHRNTLRMGRCQHLTSEVNNNIKRIKGDKNLTTPERRVMTDGYKRMEKAIYKKHGCSKWGSMAVGISSPLLVTAFMAIRRLAAYEDDLESADFLWVKDLTMPDPTMALPVICTVLFVSNFEMNQSLNRGGRSAVSMYIRWAIRVGAIAFAYYFSSQPSCLFAYWIGMSTAGMLQPLLLRNMAFRKYWNFPDPPKTVLQHDEQQSPLKWLVTKLTNKQFSDKATQEAKEREAKAAVPKYETVNDAEIVLDDEPVAARKTSAR